MELPTAMHNGESQVIEKTSIRIGTFLRPMGAA